MILSADQADFDFLTERQITSQNSACDFCDLKSHDFFCDFLDSSDFSRDFQLTVISDF